MYYNNNFNYTNNNKYIYNTVPRNWIKLAQIVGTFLSVLSLMFYIYYIKDIYNLLSFTNDEYIKKTIISLLLSIIIYFVWKNIYISIIIINLVNKSSNEELSANRYIISSLSLTVGGLFTPFLITNFPNIDTISDIKPRYFLSKIMGFCILIGSLIFLFSYFASLLIGINKINPNFIFNINYLTGIISTIVLILGLIIFIFGILTVKLFYSKNISNNLAYNNYSKLAKIISNIWMIILTIELLIVILFSLIRLINAFIDLFKTTEKGSNLIMIFFAFLNLYITISYVAMVIYITIKTIKGLWSIDGIIIIKKYKHNNYTQNQIIKNNILSS